MKTILAILMLLVASTVMAHNKVVVIPMEGDAKIVYTGQIEAFAPVAKESPPDSDYTIGTYTVIDKITSLEWQKEDDDSTRDWYTASYYCGELTLDSKDDWRLPSILELMSIVRYDTYDPAINGTAFPSTHYESLYYWSASSNSRYGGRRWTVWFNDGWVAHDAITVKHYVRCVRTSRQSGPLLQDNTNGTVTDLATGLTWQKEDDNVPKNWNSAVNYCSTLNLGNKNDWRLPNAKELVSIIDFRLYDPAIDSVMFPSTNEVPYWSATNAAETGSASAWRVYFTHAGVHYSDKINPYYVRCVR